MYRVSAVLSVVVAYPAERAVIHLVLVKVTIASTGTPQAPAAVAFWAVPCSFCQDYRG